MTRHTSQPIENLGLAMTNEPFSQLVSQWKRGSLDPNPPYQRGPVWTRGQQIALIESVLSGTPLPAIITNRRGHSMARTRYVIDGLQRLTAFRAFLDDHLLVPASWFGMKHVSNPVDLSGDPQLAREYEDEGLYVAHGNLSEYMQTVIDNLSISVAGGHFRTMEEEAAVYLRVNGYGTPQTKEDLERALRVAEGRA
jgi:hypothetical protein